MPHVSIAIDSEFQSLIPPLSDDEYERLEKSILAEGFHDWEPIVTWNGTIIDGHNRYNICDEHGIEFKTVEREFASREAAKIWIIEHQFGRRNLSTYDRATLALELEEMYKSQAKKRLVTSTGGRNPRPLQNSAKAENVHTDERLAKLAGTSRDTIRKVRVIEQEAANGNETAIEARDAVKSGEKSIHKAYIEVRPKADKADSRPLCVICGEPIDDGDAYDHNQFKHKKCAVVDTETHRGSKGGRPPTGKFAKAQYTEDGRRICSLCGEPIDEGDAYDHHPHLHKACFNKNTNDARRRRIESQNITIGDVNEVIEHDKAELKRQLMFDVNSAWSNLQATLDRYESMGVTVTDSESSRIRDAIEPLVSAIQGISEE